MSLCIDASQVLDLIKQKNYTSIPDEVSDFMPESELAREHLDTLARICSERVLPRLIEVERVDDYRVFICIPGQKSKCDFVTWRYCPNMEPQLKIPTHDDLGREFIRLKKLHHTIDRYLVEAIKALIRERRSIKDALTNYFSDIPDQHLLEIKKFLVTLKWISLQEDVNYPPPRYLGSKYALAIYVLLEGGFELKDVRKIIRF